MQLRRISPACRDQMECNRQTFPAMPLAVASLARRGRGLTLMEILLVLAILVVLASMAFAAIFHRQRQAQAMTTHTRLQWLAAAARLYAADHGGRPPKGDARQAIAKLMRSPAPAGCHGRI